MLNAKQAWLGPTLWSSLFAQSNMAEACSLPLRANFSAPDPQWVCETIKQFLTHCSQTDCLVGYVCHELLTHNISDLYDFN